MIELSSFLNKIDKGMCWVTVDRAIRLAGKRSLWAPFDRWRDARNAMSKGLRDNFWNEETGHFSPAFTTSISGQSLTVRPSAIQAEI